MEQLVKTLREHIDRKHMMDTAQAVTAYHRIQASTGFRAAARSCVARLAEGGIEARIVGYQADGVPKSKLARNLMEWDIRGGDCRIEGFGTIADFAVTPISILPRSIGCDFRDQPLEVVYLDQGSRMEAYDGWDLKGKLVFVRENHARYAWAAEQMGAAGVITDFVLHPAQQQEVVRYTAFWWKETPEEVKYFGFGMTPAQGAKLAAFCLSMRERGRPVLAAGYIDASFYPGSMDVVEATLPGQEEGYITLVAHLCHPAPSANDNASGVAAGIEALSVIRQAVSAGHLPPLRRGLRLLLVPEMSGTWAYMDSPGYGDVLAALNLDMVGARQEEGYGPLTVTALPLSTPSFTEYAAMLALELSACNAVHTDFGGNPVPMVNTTVAAFATGSDHYILTDPTVGVPCTMLGQWPDRFYHTSGDTFDRLCPEVLTASCTTAAAFAYCLCNLNQGLLGQLLDYGKGRFAGMLARLNRRGVQDGFTPGQRAARLTEAFGLAAADALRFFPAGEVDASVAAQQEAVVQIAAAMIASGSAAGQQDEDSRVLTRRYRGPVQDLDLLLTPEEGKELPAMGSTSGALTQYYINGKRTYSQIVRLVCMDTGCQPQQVEDRLDALLRAGIVTAGA